METSQITLYEFIDKILCEFKEYFPLQTILKLKTIYLYEENPHIKNREIQQSLKKEISYPYIKNRFSLELIEKKIAPYFNKGQKKITRLKKETITQQNLLKIIETKTFITTVLKKYPYPIMVGFPFNSWNTNSLFKYIQLYFELSDENPPILSLKTVDIYFKNQNLTPYSLANVLTCYNNLERKNKKIEIAYYYLHTIIQKYLLSSSKTNDDKKSYREYSKTYFFILYFFGEKLERLGTINHLSVNRHQKKELDFSSLQEVCIDNVKTQKDKASSIDNTIYTSIFIINQSILNKELEDYYADLTSLPDFKMILIKDLLELDEVAKMKNFEWFNDFLPDLKDQVSKINKLKMQNFSELNNFVKSIRHILSSSNKK